MGVLESERERKRRLRSGAKTEYFDAVLRQVKFSWDHEEIENELDEHILEECAYLRARKDLDAAEAERETLKRMGPPEQLGKLLNQAHNPWIGRVWILTTAAAVLLALWFAGYSALLGMSGNLPWQERTPLTPEQRIHSVEKKYDMEVLYHVECDEELKLDSYSLRFTDVYYTHIQNDQYNGKRGYYLWLFTETEGDAGRVAVTHMNASHFTDDDGNLISGPAVPKTDVHGYWTDEWAWNTDVNWRNDGSPYIIFADVEERLQAINVNYDVFGQKAACRIDLSEAKRQYGEVQ